MPRKGKRSRNGTINVENAPQVQAAVARREQAADGTVEAAMSELGDASNVAHGPMDVEPHAAIVVVGNSQGAPSAAAAGHAAASGHAAAELARLAEFGGVGAARHPVVAGTARDRQRSVRLPSASPSEQPTTVSEQPTTATDAARPLSSEEDAEARAVAAELLEAQIGDRRLSASSLRAG